MSRSQSSSHRGAPAGNQNARRHGYYARKARPHPEAASNGGGAHAAGSPPEGEVGSPASPSPIPTLDDLILELYAKQRDLATYLTDLSRSDAPDVEARKLAAFDLFRQGTATLGRLLAYRGQGDRDRELTGALNQALDLMSRELGIQL